MKIVKGHPVTWAYLTMAVFLVGWKAFGVLDWSWWAVTAPLWGPFALVVALLVVLLAVCVLGLCLVILGLGAAMRTMVEAAARVAVEHNRRMRQEESLEKLRRADRVREQAERN